MGRFGGMGRWSMPIADAKQILCVIAALRGAGPATGQIPDLGAMHWQRESRGLGNDRAARLGEEAQISANPTINVKKIPLTLSYHHGGVGRLEANAMDSIPVYDPLTQYPLLRLPLATESVVLGIEAFPCCPDPGAKKATGWPPACWRAGPPLHHSQPRERAWFQKGPGRGCHARCRAPGHCPPGRPYWMEALQRRHEGHAT